MSPASSPVIPAYDFDSLDVDDEKKPAIRTTEGPLLIIAGPGSGKTRTLVERVIYLVSQGVAPERIMVATFTEKAASELITRISNRLIEHDLRVDTWFQNNYRSLSQATRTYLAPNALQSLFSQIIRYKDRHQNDWHRIREAEVDVSLVKEDYILEGTIDLIRSDAGDTVELMDFKTGPKPDLNAAADRALLDRYRRQLEVYAHLVEERTDVKVSRMHLYYTAEKEGVPTISYERGRANVEKTIASFDAVVAKIEAKNFDMTHITKSEKLCGNCDMRHHCNPVYPSTSTRA